jgi:hypothetical protein
MVYRKVLIGGASKKLVIIRLYSFPTFSRSNGEKRDGDPPDVGERVRYDDVR